MKHAIFQEFPDSLVSTKFGEFRAPYHCYAAQSYTMLGGVSLEAADNRIEGEGLFPLKFRISESEVVAGAQVSFIDYADTNYGPYRELVFSLFTTEDPVDPVYYRNETSLLCLASTPERIVFTIELHLDSDSGLVAGRDVGGMPKKRAQLQYDFDNHSFLVSNENGLVARLDATDEQWFTEEEFHRKLLVAYETGRVDEVITEVETYRVATPVNPLRRWMEVQIVAPAKLALPGSSLDWSYETAEQFNFRPLLISYMPNIQYVMRSAEFSANV